MTSKRTEPNHFNHIRLLASFAVLVSHAFILYAPGGVEPLFKLRFYNTLGGMAVCVFFTMSGYLISQSFARSKSLKDYLIKRALRIVPGLYFVVLVTMLVIGPLVSHLGVAAYFSAPDSYAYLLKNLLFWCRPADHLPGVFVQNANLATNGSLWTLPYEVIAYLSLPILALVRKPISATFVVGILCLLFAIAFLPWQELLPNHSPFAQKSDAVHASGVMFYYFYAGVLLNFLPPKYFSGRAALLLAASALGVTFADVTSLFLPIIFAICMPYCVIYLARRPAAPHKFNRLIETHDLSYGVYVWGYLVEQLMADQKIFTNLYSYIAVCAAVTTIMAFISWTYIEAPALRLKDKTL